VTVFINNDGFFIFGSGQTTEKGTNMNSQKKVFQIFLTFNEANVVVEILSASIRFSDLLTDIERTALLRDVVERIIVAKTKEENQ
jgi:hypothetical protein